MVPVLFPGIPGGVELLVILLIMLVLLGLPLFLLVVGGFGFWQLSRGDGGDGTDDETIEELRRRVDELESQLPADAPGSTDRSRETAADEDEDGGRGA
jgi:sec-independent protein translocase protein TatA